MKKQKYIQHGTLEQGRNRKILDTWNIGTIKKQKNIQHGTLEQGRNSKVFDIWDIGTRKKQKIRYMEHWNKEETETHSLPFFTKSKFSSDFYSLI